jgi:hypothetical protein
VSNPDAPPPAAGEVLPPPASGEPADEAVPPPAPGEPADEAVPASVPGEPADEGVPASVPGEPADEGVPGQQGTPAGVPAEPEDKGDARKALAVAGLAVVFLLIAVVVIAGLFFGDEAADAAVGDCIASTEEIRVFAKTEASAKVVDCKSADAAFTVVGRVEGESDTESMSCQQYFKQDEQYFVYASKAGKGFLLCMRPIKG